MNRLFGNHQKGDTIVEVIIAIAVVSVVLAGAFAVTSRSMTAVRDSEEHAEALQLLQGQVELLRSAASDGALPTSGLNQPFCLDGSSYYQPAASHAQCLQSSLYNLSITSPSATPVSGGTTTFNLVATWQALNGGTDTVQLSYKVEVS